MRGIFSHFNLDAVFTIVPATHTENFLCPRMNVKKVKLLCQKGLTTLLKITYHVV